MAQCLKRLNLDGLVLLHQIVAWVRSHPMADAAPPAAEPFCPARHAAEEDEFGAIAGRTAIR